MRASSLAVLLACPLAGCTADKLVETVTPDELGAWYGESTGYSATSPITLISGYPETETWGLGLTWHLNLWDDAPEDRTARALTRAAAVWEDELGRQEGARRSERLAAAREEDEGGIPTSALTQALVGLGAVLAAVAGWFNRHRLPGLGNSGGGGDA